MKYEKKVNLKSLICAIIPVISFIAVSTISTYAFYLAGVVGNEDNGDLALKSAQVFAVFNATDSLNVEKMLPGYNGQIEFSVVNTSTEEEAYGNYSLAWDIVTNEIDNESFVYTLEGTSDKDGAPVSEGDTNKLVTVPAARRIPSVSSVIGTGTINTGVAHKYVLKINFLESGTDQNNLQGKKFEGKIVAKGDTQV